jgi:hypothetical protein
MLDEKLIKEALDQFGVDTSKMWTMVDLWSGAGNADLASAQLMRPVFELATTTTKGCGVRKWKICLWHEQGQLKKVKKGTCRFCSSRT